MPSLGAATPESPSRVLRHMRFHDAQQPIQVFHRVVERRVDAEAAEEVADVDVLRFDPPRAARGALGRAEEDDARPLVRGTRRPEADADFSSAYQ